MYLPDISSIHCISNYCTKYTYLLWVMPVVILLIFFITKSNFIKFSNTYEQREYLKSRKIIRWAFFILRSSTFLLVIIALASPFTTEPKKVQGDSTLTILVDNSSSFAIFETGAAGRIESAMKGQIPLKIRSIGYAEHSGIGDGILNSIERDTNLLVITDGNNNEGRRLGDTVIFASSLNATVSTLDLKPIKSDVGVSIEGPSEAIKDNVEQFNVNVMNVGKELNYHIEVEIDGQVVLGQEEKGSSTFAVSKKLSGQNYHKIIARIKKVQDDYFEQNNVFYKSVKIVQRPKLLFVSKKESPLLTSLGNIYDVTKVSEIPNDLSSYFAVIVDDMNIAELEPHLNLLTQYLSDGNGLMVIGGMNSYDRGGYKKSVFETLLPVKVGSGEESKETGVNIVLAIDISHGTKDYIDTEKMLAKSVLESLKSDNGVGAVAFNYDTAYKVADIKPLNKHKKELTDKIESLIFTGNTWFTNGLSGAYALLKDKGGSKNIIFISDGKTTWDGPRKDAKDYAKNLAARGVTVYVVGVGTELGEDKQFLQELAEAGNGIYYPADESNKLKILFGEASREDEEFYNSLSVIDKNHFITSGLEVDAVISGYNYVIPKPSSRFLITTNKKIPILIAWRFGLGRAVSMATDDGSLWSGELLKGNNSMIITRSVNWAIGNPNRKKGFDVDIKDTSVGKRTPFIITSSEILSSTEYKFAKIEANQYSSEFSSETAGFHDVLGAVVAVNHNPEYSRLGVNEEFLNVVKSTGGFVFNPDDTKKMIDDIKSISKRTKLETVYFRSYFIIAALIIFLIDVTIRRFKEYHIKIR